MKHCGPKQRLSPYIPQHPLQLQADTNLVLILSRCFSFSVALRNTKTSRQLPATFSPTSNKISHCIRKNFLQRPTKIIHCIRQLFLQRPTKRFSLHPTILFLVISKVFVVCRCHLEWSTVVLFDDKQKAE